MVVARAQVDQQGCLLGDAPLAVERGDEAALFPDVGICRITDVILDPFLLAQGVVDDCPSDIEAEVELVGVHRHLGGE